MTSDKLSCLLIKLIINLITDYNIHIRLIRYYRPCQRYNEELNSLIYNNILHASEPNLIELIVCFLHCRCASSAADPLPCFLTTLSQKCVLLIRRALVPLLMHRCLSPIRCMNTCRSPRPFSFAQQVTLMTVSRSSLPFSV